MAPHFGRKPIPQQQRTTRYSAFGPIGQVPVEQIPLPSMGEASRYSPFTPKLELADILDQEVLDAQFDTAAPQMGNGSPYSVIPVSQPGLDEYFTAKPYSYGSVPQRKSQGIPQGNDYFSTLFAKESTNNWKAVNRLNYLGGYQMGASALVEAGLVKKGTTNKGLNNAKNWLGGMSKEKFLDSPDIQDSAVRKYTDKNMRYLGDLYQNASESERRGLLASAHLIGAGGTKKNMKSKDANGVSGDDYYNYFSNIVYK